MQGILARRRQLVGMLTAENNRLPLATKPVAKRIAAHVRWLEKDLLRTESMISVRSDQEQHHLTRERGALEERARSGPGSLARTLLAEVPEL